jgi:hypothetical protein
MNCLKGVNISLKVPEKEEYFELFSKYDFEIQSHMGR